MKFILILLFITSNVFSQQYITTTEVAEHIGDSVYVKGTVSEIFVSEKGNKFISFDNKYPEHSFSVVLFERNRIDISMIKVGSILTVIGKINSFNDKPQIIISSSEQIVKIE